jgi:UDP-N-acetylmuramoyl-tripeptide--D-alanyl-D-alanine ligase
MNVEKIYKLFTKFPHVVTDSREVKKNSIFFGLKGEKFNGNKFAGEALQKGAAYAVIDDEKFVQPRTILVENVLETLQSLASLHRKRLKIPVLAITGSNGKTTTKELIAAVLSKKFTVSFTMENYNNHIGLPLTLLSMTRKTTTAIVEMGANHSGEISLLCSIADPDYGIITNIGRAHLEGFGTFETVIKTKNELYNYLKNKKGTIFYNQDNPILSKLIGNYPRKISYGQKGREFQCEPVYKPPFIDARIHFPDKLLYISTNLTGSYNFENIMAAISVGHFFGVEIEQIRDAIQDYAPQNNRSQLIEKKGMKIVMDAYNANPTSMKASIQSFVSDFYNPRCLILGDMLELGSYSEQEHNEIIKEISKYLFKKVFLIGQNFSKAAKNYNYKTFDNTDNFCRYIQQNPLNGCSLLIKGSRAMQLEKVIRFL